MNDSKVANPVASMWTRIGVKTSVDAYPGVLQEPRQLCVLHGLSGGPRSVTNGEMPNTRADILLVTRNRETGLGTTNRSRYSNPKVDGW